MPGISRILRDTTGVHIGARVVLLGSGIAGHIAASLLREWLAKEHEVILGLKMLRIIRGGSGGG